MQRGLLSVLSGVWALDKNKANAFLPLVEKMLRGETRKVLSIEECEAEVLKSERKISTSNDLYMISEFGNYSKPEDAPKGSIAVIPFMNVITKYDQVDECGFGVAAGTITKNNVIQRAMQNDNIEGIILFTDSPGGEAGASERIVNTLKKRTKPVYSVIDGVSASAMYDISAATDKIFITSEYDEAGSIGAFVTVLDYTEYFQKQGINIIQLYDEESKLKNADVREAMNGKPQKLQEYINKIGEMFRESVKTTRGDLITDKNAWKGKLYLGSDAMDAGIVDDMISFDAAVGMMESEIITNENKSKKSIYLV